MTLPARIKQKGNRTGRWKSTAHRDFVRGHACSNCGSTVNVQFAHVRMGSDAGIGRKPSDFFGVSLCEPCHLADQHMNGEPEFWAAYEAKTGQSVQRLMDEFNAASPRAAQIRAAKQERGLV